MGLVDDALLAFSGGMDQLDKDRQKAARNLVERLISEFGYSEISAGLILGYFQRHNGDLEY